MIKLGNRKNKRNTRMSILRRPEASKMQYWMWFISPRILISFHNAHHNG